MPQCLPYTIRAQSMNFNGKTGKNLSETTSFSETSLTSWRKCTWYWVEIIVLEKIENIRYKNGQRTYFQKVCFITLFGFCRWFSKKFLILYNLTVPSSSKKWVFPGKQIFNILLQCYAYTCCICQRKHVYSKAWILGVKVST